MIHLNIKDEDVHAWPIGSSIIVRFPYEEDESDLTARAAMITATSELKEAIEQAAKALSANSVLRTVQFYWPFNVVTNTIYGQPIPKQYSKAIKEILDSDYEQAIADETARSAIWRMSDLEPVTWVSVERPSFGIGGGTVRIGCTIMKHLDFSATVRSITASTNVSDYEPKEDRAEKLVRAIDDLYELSLHGVDKSS